MKRMRSVSIYLGAILAASAVAAASASATVRPHFVFAGTPPPTSEEVNIKLVSPSANFYVEGSSSRLIECTMARGHGEILNSFGGIGMINKLAITFEECSVPGHTTTCSINGSLTHGSIKTAVIESELGYEPPAVTSEVLFNMVPNGGVFGEVTFSGTSCPLAPGTYQIEKGVIPEIPSIDVDTASPIAWFLGVFELNAFDEQWHKEIEVMSGSTILDHLKLGAKGIGLEAELEFNLTSGKVTIKTT